MADCLSCPSSSEYFLSFVELMKIFYQLLLFQCLFCLNWLKWSVGNIQKRLLIFWDWVFFSFFFGSSRTMEMEGTEKEWASRSSNWQGLFPTTSRVIDVATKEDCAQCFFQTLHQLSGLGMVFWILYKERYSHFPLSRLSDSLTEKFYVCEFFCSLLCCSQ